MSGDMTMRRGGDRDLGKVLYARGLFDGMRVMAWTTNDDSTILPDYCFFAFAM
jgi:hypothetical protein